ncbi:restriction endonuclease subunit S [Reyranella sp.]|jgi:type I restriction enzyme S subunit|uniref:restriction endonuclease subunit S n=1 Tax=Reyranella sp. TaxID=1929291 RepID=UPI000BD5FF66|nr:restriction endonuclease subunit S [Reyranella sp.]OYY41553.1 MAG: hypothetical protein B7Y57_12905 [Rhodospirillales bacterium 35-66-84]OYZ93415.1 MAG: hypothetical protein B7Y08_17510 [Rhodospirillales bacterium 24-66-33]OZB24913.1 MAG: hypothetical protein B7X63_14915 [Rhodospirillales bacterium 39-66-50]HQS15553.1 restriction endonuclease subunit S [Reyranella sp.]HQT12819.1 restriction endonuclease subunit S [Reyranella sp.]
MRADWSKKCFEDCIESVVYTQKIQRKDFLSTGQFPIVSQEEDFINGYWDRDADLFRVASPVIAFSVSGKYWVNNHAHILKFNNMATQRFVEFYLESTKLDEYITGAAQPKLNQKALNSIPIPIPGSLEAQAEIVESFVSVRRKTHNLATLYEHKLTSLEALKKSLLYQAFTGNL